MSDIDVLGLIMDYEGDGLDNERFFILFAELVRTGQAWSLQGSYGRTAQDLIEGGYISPEGEVLYEV